MDPDFGGIGKYNNDGRYKYDDYRYTHDDRHYIMMIAVTVMLIRHRGCY